MSYFSRRASSAAFVLSLLPSLTPRLVRARHQGRYPVILKVIYLFLQFIALPFVAVAALMKKGSIMRGYFKKVTDE